MYLLLLVEWDSISVVVTIAIAAVSVLVGSGLLLVLRLELLIPSWLELLEWLCLL